MTTTICRLPRAVRRPAAIWARIPSWAWHRAGAEAVRARTIIGAARVAARLEETTGLPHAEADRRLTGILAGLGFVAESEPGPAGIQIRLLHCPFREVAQEHQAVVCSLHLGLMRGALAEMAAPLTVDRLDPFVEPSLCLAHLSAQPDDGKGQGAPCA